MREPEHTRLSLLAKAMVIPFCAAFITGNSPLEPVTAATTISVS